MKLYSYLISILILLAKACELTGSKSLNYERKLVNYLFKNYDKNLRPSYYVEINFSLYLNQIITLIEQEQILVLNVFLDHEWVDQRLSWNPEQYGNITLLRINSALLWT